MMAAPSQRRRSLARLLGSLGLLGAAAFSSSAAGAFDGVPLADARAVRQVIEAQLAAFAADDARAAFELAAPPIREQFGDADRFLAMVRQGYPVVYGPAAVAFLQPDAVPRLSDALIQRVQLTDHTGRAWIAVYQMQRQPGGLWRIAGCDVSERNSRFT